MQSCDTFGSMSDLIQLAVEEIISKENLINPKISFNSLTKSGYVADVSTIEIQSDSGVLNLFMKKTPDRLSTDKTLLYRLFKCEADFYDKVVPQFQLLEQEFNVKQPFTSVPKCYYTKEGQLIILENLTAKGFKLWTTLREPLNHQHLDFVFREYGKFHALSHAFKYKNPNKFIEVCPKVEFIEVVMEKYKSIKLFESVAIKATAGFAEDEKDCINAFMDLINVNSTNFLKSFKADDTFDVILHGDNWTNNFLFYYENEIPTKMCFVDFQLMRRASPISDLSYFICTSGCDKRNFNNLENYFKVYHSSLLEYTETLGYNFRNDFPFETFLDQWKQYGKYGLFWAMVINKMMVADTDEVELNRSEGNLLAGFNFISRNEKLYQNRMRDAIMYFYNNNML